MEIVGKTQLSMFWFISSKEISSLKTWFLFEDGSSLFMEEEEDELPNLEEKERKKEAIEWGDRNKVKRI